MIKFSSPDASCSLWRASSSNVTGISDLFSFSFLLLVICKLSFAHVCSLFCWLTFFPWFFLPLLSWQDCLLFHVCLSSQTSGLRISFPSAPFMFASLCSSFVIFSIGFVIRALPHKHRVYLVIFSLFPLVCLIYFTF